MLTVAGTNGGNAGTITGSRKVQPPPQTWTAEVRVVDLGVVVARAERDQEVVGEVGLEVELDALAVRLVGIEQRVEVRSAADRRQLLVVHRVLVDGEAEPAAVVEQVRLDAGLVGNDVLGLGDGDGVAEQEAALDRGRAEALGDARIEVRVFADRPGGADVPARRVPRRY